MPRAPPLAASRTQLPMRPVPQPRTGSATRDAAERSGGGRRADRDHSSKDESAFFLGRGLDLGLVGPAAYNATVGGQAPPLLADTVEKVRHRGSFSVALTGPGVVVLAGYGVAHRPGSPGCSSTHLCAALRCSFAALLLISAVQLR